MRIESRAFHKLGRHGTSQGFAKRPAMYLFLSILYVLVCLFLILVVLLQPGRGGMGGAFGGGSSQTVFGGSGAGNFLTRLTSVSAALFMILSATLAYMSSSSDKSLERAAEAARAKQAAKQAQQKSKEGAPTPAKPSTIGGDQGASAPLEMMPDPYAPADEAPEAPAAAPEPAAPAAAPEKAVPAAAKPVLPVRAAKKPAGSEPSVGGGDAPAAAPAQPVEPAPAPEAPAPEPVAPTP